VAYTRGAFRHKTKSVGRPLTGVEIIVKRDDGLQCVPGELGEVFVRTPSLFDGYLIQGQTMWPSLSDGLFATGDLGYKDQDGELYITSRKDDILITAGHKVSPADIESIVREVPSVSDCIVFGIDDSLIGTRIICAFVTAKELAQPELVTQIRSTCAESLAPFQMPKAFVSWNWIPTTDSGKPSRSLAQAFYLRQVAA